MSIIELKFPVKGTVIDSDHGYPLYAALSRLIPEVHRTEGILISGISGVPDNQRKLHLQKNSKLRIRLPAERISSFLKLAGKSVMLNHDKVSFGIPVTHLLKPYKNLYSRLVLIKVANEFTEESFFNSAKKQLENMGITAEPILFKNPQDGNFIRKTLSMKGKTLVG